MKRVFSVFLFCLLISIVGCSNEEKTKTTSVEEKTKQGSKNIENEKEQSEQVEQKTEQVEKVETKKINFSQDEQKYYEIFQKAFDMFNEDTGVIFDSLKEANNNPALYMDKQWQERFNIRFIRIEMTKRVFDDMVLTNNVPDLFDRTHTLTIETFTLVLQGKNMVLDGANNNDYIKIKEGIDTMTTSIDPKLDTLMLEAESISEIRYIN